MAQENAPALPQLVNLPHAAPAPAAQHQVLIDQVAQLRADIAVMKTRFNADMTTRFDQLHTDIVNTNTRIETLSTRLDVLDAKVDHLDNRFNAMYEIDSTWAGIRYTDLILVPGIIWRRSRIPILFVGNVCVC
jgi:septal ring factor EnvC (AmiA/AmiB activator)